MLLRRVRLVDRRLLFRNASTTSMNPYTNEIVGEHALVTPIEAAGLVEEVRLFPSCRRSVHHSRPNLRVQICSRTVPSLHGARVALNNERR